jgi:site-specific recombinase XerD
MARRFYVLVSGSRRLTLRQVTGNFRQLTGSLLLVMVPMEGVEPTHSHEYQILSLARLPIPPHRLWLRLAAPKGRRERHLPLPSEVGQALASYLRSAPPNQTTRLLFRTVGDQRPMRSCWLFQRVGTAMAHAGLGAPGKRAHLLRRTFATHLVQQGASLKAVADLLDHASLSTTQVYAKVNLPMLRAVAQPRPGEVRP